VRPCDIELAVRTLAGSAVVPGSVLGFPHGSQTTATKLYEARDLLRRGARELDMAIALPKLLSREFQYVQTELLQVSEICHGEGAILKVILDNPYLTDELKIIGCRCCERAEVDFVATCSAADAPLMRRNLPAEIGIKIGGDWSTLEQVLEVQQAGAGRVGTIHTAAILEEWKARQTAA
jgi:deoxyribose-phosphate aldolase